MRYCDGDFDLNMIGTAGVDFRKKNIDIEGQSIKLVIYDTAGQQRFRSITKHFYQGCDGIILVFDTSDSNTFANLKDWLTTIKVNAKEDVQILIVANKIDLPRQVSSDDGKKFSIESNVQIVETSAKTGFGVHKSFETLIRNILLYNENELNKKKEGKADNNTNVVNIEKDTSTKKNNSGCCSKS